MASSSMINTQSQSPADSTSSPLEKPPAPPMFSGRCRTERAGFSRLSKYSPVPSVLWLSTTRTRWKGTVWEKAHSRHSFSRDRRL